MQIQVVCKRVGNGELAFSPPPDTGGGYIHLTGLNEKALVGFVKGDTYALNVDAVQKQAAVKAGPKSAAA